MEREQLPPMLVGLAAAIRADALARRTAEDMELPRHVREIALAAGDAAELQGRRAGDSGLLADIGRGAAWTGEFGSYNPPDASGSARLSTVHAAGPSFGAPPVATIIVAAASSTTDVAIAAGDLRPATTAHDLDA